MVWTLVATGTASWSGITTGGDIGKIHLLGSPLGLLLALTYPTYGDVTWNQGYDTNTVWTEV